MSADIPVVAVLSEGNTAGTGTDVIGQILNQPPFEKMTIEI